MWERNGEAFDFESNKTIWNGIVNYMSDEIREEVHREYAPCDRNTFIAAYLDKDPDFERLLADEFGIELK